MKYKADLGQAEAYIRAGYASDARNYLSAAKIIEYLGITSITLLTGSDSKADKLRKLGVNVTVSKHVF